MAEQNDDVIETQPEPIEEPKATDTDLEHWKSMSRKNERDAKKALADLTAAQEAGAKVQADLDAANARIAELEAQAAYADAVRQVAEATGYPETVVRGLKGATVEELTASANVLKTNLSAYPPTRDPGEPKAPVITRESIESIKDPRERIRARAQNIGLYE